MSPRILLAVLLAVLACGGSEEAPQAEPTQRQAPQPATPEQPIEPISVEVNIVKMQDVSYPGRKRGVARAVIDAESVPDSAAAEQMAHKIWGEHGEDWDEFTVFLYLPGMNTDSAAWAIGSFSTDGPAEFSTNNMALYNTTFWAEVESTRKTDQPKAAPTATQEISGAREYTISLEAHVVGEHRIDVRIRTDLPEGTLIGFSASRDHWLSGTKDIYSGEIHAEKLSAQTGEIAVEFEVDDSGWISEHEALVQSVPDVFAPIARIADEISLEVLYSSAWDQPESVVKILGDDGEYISGPEVKHLGPLVTLSSAKTLPHPVVR